MLGNVGDRLTFNVLVDTGATGYSFIDTVIAQTVCERLQIQPVRLLKPKPLKGFDGRPGRDITHAIYPTMTIHDHVETVTPMLITHLGTHPIILGKPWMNKHQVMLDMTNDRIVFGRCCNSSASSALAPTWTYPIAQIERSGLQPRAPRPYLGNSGPQPPTPTLPKPIEPVKTLPHLGDLLCRKPPNSLHVPIRTPAVTITRTPFRPKSILPKPLEKETPLDICEVLRHCLP